MSPSLPAHRWPSLGLLGLIQLYKWTLSPLIGRDCRYLPTCSSYAADAIRGHGAWAGSWMATARICRCHPWGGRGYDPAPTIARKNSWWRPWRYGDWKGGAETFSLAEKAAREGAPDEGRSSTLTSEAPGRPSPPPRKGKGDASPES